MAQITILILVTTAPITLKSNLEGHMLKGNQEATQKKTDTTTWLEDTWQ